MVDLNRESKRKRNYIVVIIAVILGALYWAGASNQPGKTGEFPTLGTAGKRSGEQDAPPAPTWTELASWTGSGIKTTQSFLVQSNEWRIRWTSGNETFRGAGLLQIYVYNDTGQLITLAANKQGSGSDISYVRGKGTYYLTINSGNVDWNVTVEDQR